MTLTFSENSKDFEDPQASVTKVQLLAVITSLISYIDKKTENGSQFTPIRRFARTQSQRPSYGTAPLFAPSEKSQCMGAIEAILYNKVQPE
jgi:hypothetical protein